MAIPSDVAGLTNWYKADAITGLNDGDTVTSWADSSGIGRHLGTVAGTPTYQTGEINGLPIVRFDGVDDSLLRADGAGYITGTTLTLLAVYRRMGTGAANDRSMAFTPPGSVSDHNNVGSFLVYEGSGFDREAVFRQSVERTSEVPHPGNNVPMLATVWFDGTNCNQRLNGNPTSTSSGASTGNFNIARVVLGAAYVTFVSSWGQYDFGEVCLYGSDIGATDRGAIEDYLTAKWVPSWPPVGEEDAPETLRVVQATQQWG